MSFLYLEVFEIKKINSLESWPPPFFLLEWIDSRFQCGSYITLFDVQYAFFWQKCCCVGGLPFLIIRSFKICYQFIIVFMMLNNNWYLVVDFMLWISNLLMPYFFLIKCLVLSFLFYFFFCKSWWVFVIETLIGECYSCCSFYFLFKVERCK